MPIYAYKCDACGHRKDVLQKISDPLLTDCPACGAAAFVKQVTAAGFQLKGSGWYVTDFRDGGGKKKSDAAEGAAEPGADGAKAADKPADKASEGASSGGSEASAGATAAKPAAPSAPAATPSGASSAASSPAAAPSSPAA